MRPVVEKEILHYDIFHVMHQHGYLKDLVFLGETCLRLVHGSDRFSEDLDFAGEPDFTPASLGGMADAITKHLEARYGLPVTVKPPVEQRGRTAHTWWISMNTEPSRIDVPSQHIKVDISNATAQTREIMNLRRNYLILPPSFSNIAVPVETPQEIMADKIVALTNTISRTNVRYKDIWDIGLLSRRMNDVYSFADMIERKVEVRGIQDFDERLDILIHTLPETVESASFQTTMRRFLTPSTLNRTLVQPDFRAGLSKEVRDVLVQTRDALEHPDSSDMFRFRI